MHLVFYRTTDVFEAEELLQNKGMIVDIVPTPVQDKAYCGVCIRISEEDLPLVKEYIHELDFVLVKGE